MIGSVFNDKLSPRKGWVSLLTRSVGEREKECYATKTKMLERIIYLKQRARCFIWENFMLLSEILQTFLVCIIVNTQRNEVQFLKERRSHELHEIAGCKCTLKVSSKDSELSSFIKMFGAKYSVFK